MNKIKFSTTENVQEYVNFINDNDLCERLDNFETGYQNGSFFIEIEGKEEVVEQIKKLKQIKKGRGKYERTQEHKLKQSKIQIKRNKEKTQ